MFSFLATIELFWIVSFIGFIAIAFLVEAAYVFGASIVFAAIGIFAYMKYDALGPYIISHPIETVGWVIAYFAIGLVWALGKWYLYVKSILWGYKRFEETNRTPNQTNDQWFAEINSSRNFCSNVVIELNEEGRPSKGIKSLKIKPLAAKNKERILGWMAFWPASFIFTMLDDPIQKLVEGIFKRTKKIFDLISEKVFEKVNAELNKIEIDIEKDKA